MDWVPNRCFASLCTFALKVPVTFGAKVTGTRKRNRNRARLSVAIKFAKTPRFNLYDIRVTYHVLNYNHKEEIRNNKQNYPPE